MRRAWWSLYLVACVATSPAAADPAAELAAAGVDADNALSRQDVFYLASDRLVTIRFLIEIEGKPFHEAWENYLDQRFKELDADEDGRLSADEKRGIPSPRMLEALGLLEKTTANQSRSMLLQKNPLADVAMRDDFGRYFERIGFRPSRVQVGRQESGVERGQVGNVLFARLDLDGDGKLNADELEKVAHALRRDDLDQDETISTAELLPTAANPFFRQSREIGPTSDSSEQLPFISLDREHSQEVISGKLISLYDRPLGGPKDNRLSREELGFTELVFGQFDTDKNGVLDDEEVQKFVLNPAPDIIITVRFSPAAGVSPFELKSSPELGAATMGDPENLATTIAFGEAHLEFAVAPSATWGKTGTADGTVAMLEGLLKAIDRDKNGYLDLQEVASQPGLGALFRDLDTDMDEKVYLPEFMEFLSPIARAAASQCRLNITGGGVDFFQSLDQNNKDGRLSIRELRALRQTVSQWDRNGDKQVAKDEFPQRFSLTVDRAQFTIQTAGQRRTATPARQRGGNLRPSADRSQGPVWFRMMDRNNDGDVSSREFLGRVEDFKELDRDGDGLIDATEAGQRKTNN